MEHFDVPAWAVAVVTGVSVLAWLELRFIPRSECKLRNEGMHQKVEAIAPLQTDLALLKNDLDHLTTVVESIATRVGANGFEPRTRRHES